MEQVGAIIKENRPGLKELIEKLNEIAAALADGKGTIGKAIKSPELHDEAVGALKTIKEAAAEFKETATEFKKVGEQANKVMAKIDEGQGPIARLLNDKTLSDKIDRTLTNLEDTSILAKEMVTSAKNVMENLEKGEGILPRLINDKPLGDKLDSIVENLDLSMESVKNITHELEVGEGTIPQLLQSDELYEKAKKTLDDMDEVFGKVARTVVEVVGDYKNFGDSSMSVSRLGIRITPNEDKYFFVGAAFLGLDAGGEVTFKEQVNNNENDSIIKPEVLLAYNIPWLLDRRLTTRVGLIEGQFGAGLDLKWDDWGVFEHPVLLTIEARDAYNDFQDDDIDENIDGALIRAYFKTAIRTGEGDEWYDVLLGAVRLYGGISRIGEDPEHFFGIGLEWADRDVKTLVSLLGTAN